MNKYRAGGRCGGDSKGSSGNKASNTDVSLASLISAREAQDASFSAPITKTSIVQAPAASKDKKSCIDIIMSYDN